MFPNPHFSKFLNDEHHKELLAQSRLVKQLAELEHQRRRPVLNWSLSRIIKGLMESFTSSKVVTQPAICPPEYRDQPNCQVS